MVEETFLPGNSVPLVARINGVAPNQLRELQRMLGKKTIENEILREAISCGDCQDFRVCAGG